MSLSGKQNIMEKMNGFSRNYSRHQTDTLTNPYSHLSYFLAELKTQLGNFFAASIKPYPLKFTRYFHEIPSICLSLKLDQKPILHAQIVSLFT